QNIISYLLLIEEGFPIGNIGGQGTEFTGNSLQWGAGHGLSLSNIPLLADLKIVKNEIQNFGQMGILSEGPTFAAMILNLLNRATGDAAAASYTFSMEKLIPIIGFILAPFSIVYKTDITQNEINNCLLNKTIGTNIVNDIFIPTLLSGVMVADAIEVNFQKNNVRACGYDLGFDFSSGDGDERWTGFGTTFIRCKNVIYDSNNITFNGKKLEDQVNQVEAYYPRGGALFFGNAGTLSINDNYFSDNNATSLLIVPGFTLASANTDFAATGLSRIYNIDYTLDNVLIISNMFNITDNSISNWAKINTGVYNYNSSMSIKDLTFSQNQVNLPYILNMDFWSGIDLAAERLLFNGNMVKGSNAVTTILLGSSIGMGMSNILARAPSLSGDIQMTDLTNRW
ncbi:MAG: hypothetical protein GY707_06055, partial [Desulfobacteraceae bacterium]|nr:hypothetical protein [Desulfobacteraceae bacterium]